MQSKRVIVGTAGHVDHGKTALIRALTGVDTDRLPEEKNRGISIELGFAEFALPSGRTAAVVDVPGHERFIKNMLAGATGIDVVLLVVAADEGVMPQTREHLEILDLLGVERGVIVITKTDLASPEWLDLVHEDVQDLVLGTFLEGARVVFASALSGQGMPEIRDAIDVLLDRVPEKDTMSYPRLPIDRSFSVPGYGRVVTGTLSSGSLKVDDRIRILPHKTDARIRNLQVHARDVRVAYAGQRVAVNVAGVDRDDLDRGYVITYPGWLEPSRRFAARVRMLKSARSALKNLQRVHLHYGTAETLARVILLDADQIEPGDSALVRLSCENPVIVSRGDRFILRSYSPVTTIGGGVVIVAPSSHRRKSVRGIEDLLQREKRDPLADTLALLSKPPYFRTKAELSSGLGLTHAAIEQSVAELVSKNQLAVLGTLYGSETVINALLERLRNSLSRALIDRPLRLSAGKDELRRWACPEIDSKMFNVLLAEAVQRAVISVSGDRVRLPEDTRQLPERQRLAVESAHARLRADPFSPPTPEAMLDSLGLSALEQSDLLMYLVETGSAVRISENLIMDAAAVEHARQKVLEALDSRGTITVSEFRDALGTSRKFALPMLEHFDRVKVTRRRGDERIPYHNR